MTLVKSQRLGRVPIFCFVAIDILSYSFGLLPKLMILMEQFSCQVLVLFPEELRRRVGALRAGRVPLKAVVTYTEPLLTLTLALSWIGVCFLGPSRAKCLLAASLLATSLVAWPPCEYMLSRPLEWHYPVRPFSTPAGAGAIVVLGSAVSPAQFERPYPLPDQETLERCQYAAWICRKVTLPVLVSGGNGGIGHPPVAATMRELLLAAGVPAELIWIEDRSRSTHENAAFSAQVLRSRGIGRVVLVVDARSMPRAAACFRREGIEVIAAPSRFRYLSAIVEDWMPGWKAVQGNEITLHEAVGLLWYRLRGWI